MPGITSRKNGIAIVKNTTSLCLSILLVLRREGVGVSKYSDWDENGNEYRNKDRNNSAWELTDGGGREL